MGSAVGLLAVTLSHLGYLERANLAWVDAVLAVGEPAEPVSRVKLVTIGDDDLRTLGFWPPPAIIPRGTLACTLDKLVQANVAVVCLDVLLDIEAPGDSQLERALVAARDRGIVVVLACTGAEGRWVMPLARFARHTRLASTDLAAGPAGEVRELLPAVQTPGGRVEAMGLVAAKALEGRSAGGRPWPSQPVLVRYRGPETTFARYPLAQLLRGDVPPDWLRGTLVVIGRTDEVSRDVYAVPLPGPGAKAFRPMRGVEIQANAIATVLGRRPPARAPLGIDIPLVLITAAVAAALVQWLGVAWGGALGLLGLVLGGGAVSVALFHTTGYVANLVPAFAAVVGHTWVAGWMERRDFLRALGPLVDRGILRWREWFPEFRVGAGRVTGLSVLTFDLRGSTRIGASTSPEEYALLVNRALAVVGTAVLGHGGMVNKFLGDGLLALFVPYRDWEKAAFHAVTAGLEAADALCAELAGPWQTAAHAPLRFVFSVHSGEAWIGFLGVPRRLELTAMGDAVNLAFELQREAKRLGCRILVSRGACNEAAPVDFSRWEPVTVELPVRDKPVECLALGTSGG